VTMEEPSEKKKNGFFKSVIDYLIYVVARLVIAFIQAMPIELCKKVANVFGVIATHWLKFRWTLIEDNLKKVYPDWSDEQRLATAQKMWSYLFMMICEIAHAPRKIHQTNWRKYVTVTQKKEIVGALLDPRPTILVSGHFGNFEVAGFVTGLIGFPSYTMARSLDNRFLDAYLNRFRAANGQMILPKDGSAQMVDQALKSGAVLTLLGDQHAGTKGCWIDFLGRPAACHKALALFTLTGGALMVVTYGLRLEEPMKFVIGSPGVADPETLSSDLLGVTPLTQWYNDRLADFIHRNPEQFWWVHRRWKEKPVRKTSKRRAA
jgi:Kdo2-lipid IVA lauroyltransferase/acyltransferase